MKKITGNVYVESEISVCNSSIFVTKEGVVVIDTPMVPASAKKWARQAAGFGPTRYVINTEPHGDHISGNCYFGGNLIAHEGTRDVILASKEEDMKRMLQMHSPGTPLDEDFKYRPPDITLTDKLTFYLGNFTFHLIAMPGHSPYQVAVYVPEERIVFTSDNISRGIGFFHQALPDKWLKTLNELKKLDVDYVVPGHGEVGSKSIIGEMENTVNIWINTVKEAIAKGMTLEEAQKNLTMTRQFPDLPADEHTKSIINMNVTAIYKYYKKDIPSTLK